MGSIHADMFAEVVREEIRHNMDVQVSHIRRIASLDKTCRPPPEDARQCFHIFARTLCHAELNEPICVYDGKWGLSAKAYGNNDKRPLSARVSIYDELDHETT